MINVFELLHFELKFHGEKTASERYMAEFSELEKNVYTRKKNFLNNKERGMLRKIRKGKFFDVLTEINDSEKGSWLADSFSEKEIEQMAYLSVASAWTLINESENISNVYPNSALYELIYLNNNDRMQAMFDEEIKKKIVTGMLIENLTDTDYDTGLDSVRQCLTDLSDCLTPEYSASSIYDLDYKQGDFFKMDLIKLNKNEISTYTEFVRKVNDMKESIFIDSDDVGMLVEPIISYIIEIDKNDLDYNDDEDVPFPGMTSSKILQDPLLREYKNNKHVVNGVARIVAKEIESYMDTYTLSVADEIGISYGVMQAALERTGNSSAWGKVFSSNIKSKFPENDIRSNTYINMNKTRKRKNS